MAAQAELIDKRRYVRWDWGPDARQTAPPPRQYASVSSLFTTFTCDTLLHRLCASLRPLLVAA